MLKKAAVIGIAGLALGTPPAAADSIDDGAVAVLTMVGGGGLMSIGCMAVALLTEEDEGTQEGYGRRGFYAGLSASYARENFSNSKVDDLVYSELLDNLRTLRGTPLESDPPTDPPTIIDPGIYTIAFDDIEDDAFGFAGRVGYRCHPRVSGELQFEWLETFQGELVETGAPLNDAPRKFDLELESLVMTVNAKGFLLTGRYQPFALLGIGFMRMESKSRDVSGGTLAGFAAQQSDREVEFALRFGAGLDFYLTENWVTTAEGSYVMPTGKLDGLDYYQFALGIQYRF